MAEEVKEKAADAKPTEDKGLSDLTSNIEESIKRGFSAALQNLPPPQRQEAPQQTYTPPPEVNDEDIIAAIEAGDRAKAATLLRQQRAASDARHEHRLNNVMGQGASVLTELSEQAIANDTDAQPYLKEIREEISKFQASNPGILATPNHWRAARDMVLGRHVKDIRESTREALIRRARENNVNLTPDGTIATGRENETHDPADEITQLAEPGSRFDEFLRNKSRAHGGRSDDEEVRVMAAKADRLGGDYDEEASRTTGRPVFRRSKYPNGIKDFWRERQEMKRYVEENPTLKLDE